MARRRLAVSDNLIHKPESEKYRMILCEERGKVIPVMMLLVCATIVASVSIRASAALAPASHPAQGHQPPELSSDPTVESLERALSEGRLKTAHDLLIQILKRPHLSSDFLLKAGIQFADRELYGEAADVFRRCIQEHPEIFEAYYDLALTEIAQQKWEAALATLRQAPRRSTAEVLACSYLRGKVEDSQGKTGEAEHDLSGAFAGAPQNPAYGMDLGMFYVHERAYLQAAVVFERAAVFNPRSSFILLGLSLSRFLAGQHEQSIGALEKVLSMQPDFAPAQLLLAFALTVEGKLKAAEKVARQGLSSPHPSPYLYYLDASILVKLQSQQYKRIFEELSIAQREIPSCSLCYLAESKAHQAQGDFEAALADLETAVRLDSNFPEAWYRLASLYRRVGRGADALRAQDRFEKLKADKEGREFQMLRENFLQTLDAAQHAQ
ncbi:MAG: tetratricopeptide repeat protein [Candidatus Sulfotelmatobacter sp.]